jgi:hypothetical protein
MKNGTLQSVPPIQVVERNRPVVQIIALDGSCCFVGINQVVSWSLVAACTN